MGYHYSASKPGVCVEGVGTFRLRAAQYADECNWFKTRCVCRRGGDVHSARRAVWGTSTVL